MNTSMTELESTVAVILDSRPQVFPIAKEEVAFDASGDHFEDVGLGSHNGFYDFLRTRTGAIIGLRYLPSADAEDVLKEVSVTGSLRFTQDGQLRVLLSSGDKTRISIPKLHRINILVTTLPIGQRAQVGWQSGLG